MPQIHVDNLQVQAVIVALFDVDVEVYECRYSIGCKGRFPIVSSYVCLIRLKRTYNFLLLNAIILPFLHILAIILYHFILFSGLIY